MSRFLSASQRKAVMSKIYRNLKINLKSKIAQTTGGTVLIPTGNRVVDLHGLSSPRSEGRVALASVLRGLRKTSSSVGSFRGMTVLPRMKTLPECLQDFQRRLDEMSFSSEKARKAFFARKVHDVMKEWKAGTLHSGRRPKKGVKDTRKVVPKGRKDWALAIALSSAQRTTDRMAEHRRVYTGGSISR